jgi:tripartite ATP-independent transporter DctM subunit
VAQDALTLLTFLGAALGVERGQSLAMEIGVDKLPQPLRDFAKALADWTVIAVAIALGVLSIPLLQSGLRTHSTVMPLNEFWSEVPLPIGLGFLALNVGRYRLIRYRWKAVVLGGLSIAAVSMALYFVWLSGIQLDEPTSLTVVGILFVLMILLGVPIAFVFAACSVIFLVMSGTSDAGVIPQQMWFGTRDFVFLAIPFFVWAGFLMGRGGLGQYLARFAQTLVGHLPGGVLQVVVVTMFFFSGLSGSKVADVAAVGSALKQAAVGEGVTVGRFSAVLAASAAMGETIPPSLVMIVLGSISSLSIGALFLAGLLPAAVMALCLVLTIYVQAVRSKEARPPRSSFAAMRRATLNAVPALFVPVVLIAGIVKGIASPTEVSSFAVVYALGAAVLIYRRMGLREFWSVATETASLTGSMLLMLSTATAFSFTLTIAQVPQAMVGLVSSLHGHPWAFMLASIALLVVLGCVLEGLPAILILAPLLIPIATSIGINPLQYGIVLIAAMGIGAFMPPIGVGLYAACLIGGATMREATRPMVGYIAMLLLGLIIVSFIPEISLFLPGLFGIK